MEEEKIPCPCRESKHCFFSDQ